VSAGAEGFNTFDCLRDMMPLTERGSFQRQRVNVERPFMAGEKYMVFPEVIARKVTGFYVYDGKAAYYYDTIEARTEHGLSASPIAALAERKDRPLYQMTAQPAGLETVTIYYMPGFNAGETNKNGPVVLGTSVMPVIGAFVSRPEQYDYAYESPKDVPENRLQDWLAKQKGGRAPASEQKVDRELVSLKSKHKKSEAELWAPLKAELSLRRKWVRDHNLDDRTFKELSRVMDGSCRE
jgi:hypothetical protein